MKNLLLFLIMAVFSSLNGSAQIPEKAEDISPLLNGETLPNVVLKTPDGSEHNLLDLVKQQPSVVLFYRGGWCPYCNGHLAEIQKAESEILGLGYQILAISPDSPENLKQTAEKDKLRYSLYSDADGKLIKLMGIAFKAPEKYAAMLNKSSGGQNEGFLPVPSVFVVDNTGTIVFEYINPDYKTRLSADLLLAVLKSLRNQK